MHHLLAHHLYVIDEDPVFVTRSLALKSNVEFISTRDVDINRRLIPFIVFHVCVGPSFDLIKRRSAVSRDIKVKMFP